MEILQAVHRGWQRHNATMLPPERITRWHQLIASYKRHRYDFNYFFLYLWFDTRENALASQLCYSPRQLIHTSGLSWHHLCVCLLPASIWRMEKKEQPSDIIDNYMHEAADFSALLFMTNPGDKERVEEPMDYDSKKALPALLRSALPPTGTIGAKLEGIKYCRDFARDYLKHCSSANQGLFIQPFYYTCNYTFNWACSHLDEIYTALPAVCKSPLLLYWLPDLQIFMASLNERSLPDVLSYCCHYLDCIGDNNLASALRNTAAQENGRVTYFSEDDGHNIHNVTSGEGDQLKDSAFGVCIYECGLTDHRDILPNSLYSSLHLNQ